MSQKLQEQGTGAEGQVGQDRRGRGAEDHRRVRRRDPPLAIFKDFLAAEPEAAMALVRQVVVDAMHTEVVPAQGMAA
jgi:hypothetical protein